MIFIIILFLVGSHIFAEEPVLKSLHYYVNNNISKLPVLRINSSDKLYITFDIESPNEPAFNIIFKFCDADWQPYDNLLLEEIGENIYYDTEVERLPLSSEGAEYHVREKFPGKNIHFRNSGKWMFFITDKYDDEIIYEWGNFYVVDNQVDLKTNISNWRREGRISGNNALDRVLNLKTSFLLPDSLTPFRVKHVEIVKNFELNYPKVLKKESFNKNRTYEWDGRNRFEFIIRDLEPGNEYRQINIRDEDKYPFPEARAKFDGIEYSRFYKPGDKDLNGGFKLLDKNNEYADYLVVRFQFSPHKDIYDDIFIVGSFTNWEVLPWFRMEESDGVYEIDIELKRGRYDYQYVTGNVENEIVENIDWRIFEGNYWDTENVYSIFLYYESPEKGGYDQIIGFNQLVR